MEHTFEWDFEKELDNKARHGCSFKVAMEVFADPKVIHLEDVRHSLDEARYYAVGRISNGEVVTVRYTWRGDVIRIFGAAKWRRWRKYYEKHTRSK